MINYSEENEKKNQNNHSKTGSAIAVGIVLVALGIIIILTNAGIIPWSLRHFLISWQMLLIVIGIFCLSSGNKTGGVVLLMVGGFFILPKLNSLFPGINIFGASFTRNFWPLLIIIAGLWLIISPRKGGTYGPNGRRTVSYSDHNDGTINYNFTFGGSEQVFLDPVFKGGSITTTFGGMTLDLRKSSLPENEPVYLKIETTFGGTTLIVPESWNVEIRQNSFMGGFTDKRFNSPSFANSKQKLIIDAKCTFGGGEIK